MTEEEIEELLEKLKQCDDFHNRCDFLMEHSEITYMLDYITKLQQENQSLKNENKILRENAEHNDKVVDKVNWENLKLKKELEEYKLITIDYQELEARNQKLKKQLEEANEKILLLQASEPMLEYKKVLEENQQKEFIEWLTNEANINPYDISDYTYEDIINTILSKYYEIIDK